MAKQFSRPWMCFGLLMMAAGAAMLCLQGRQPHAMAEPPDAASAGDAQAWQDLFDGKTLGRWKSLAFGGEGEVSVKDGAIVMDAGAMMTGIGWTGPLPRDRFELALDGMRLEGSDFFCTTTFPVGKEYCSLVVGGWGGALVGLSCVDYADASENTTSTVHEFKDNVWHRVRIRVSDTAVRAWIDDQLVVDQPREDHKFTTRIEVELCKPLGIATWCTRGAVRNIRLRTLKPDEH